MMRLAELISRFEPALRAQYASCLLPSHHRALAALKHCRSQFAPHMLAACDGCNTQRCLPHCCGHRACPQCQHHDSAQWLQRQLQALVPATYFLLTFTLPAQQRTLAWQHQRVVYEALMQCAWHTLKTFSLNDKVLAGTPGAVAVLHTHSRSLGFHPHVHVCMPAAALSADRLWRTKVSRGKTPDSREPARGGYLFNHKALGQVFAGKLRAALAQAGLPIPADLPEQWVVDCKSVGDGQAALRYLGRYLYRGVIQERDILRCKDGQVTYRWRDAKTGKSCTRSLPGGDFLWMLLQHILPKGLQRARNFGFLHHNSRRALDLLQLLKLRASPQTAQPPPKRPQWRCACGQAMRILRRRMRPESVTSCPAPQTVRPDKADPKEANTH
jgi:Putative transposase/Transposase zinc-binding domain